MSRKRSKSDSGFLQGKEDSAMDELRSASDDVPEPISGPSYASILRNGADDAMGDINLELSESDCCFTQSEHGVGLCFSKHAHEVLQRSWKSVVVVRLMGKRNSVNSFDFMLRALRRKWRSRGGWKLVDLLNDWFVVKFELEEDMEDVLCGGPWIIAGQTLVVRRWSASFNPVTDEIGSMAIWARIIGLPVMYFSEFAMQKIGQLLGVVVKVDAVTLGQNRGRFARICVEMDLAMPFKSSVWIDNVCYKVQYEGLSLLCFTCGMYGHAKDGCPTAVAAGGSDVETEKCVEPSADQEDGEMAEDGPSMAMGGHHDSQPGGQGVFGPWMLVNYKNRKKAMKSEAGTSVQKGRFSALQVEEGEGASGDDVQALAASEKDKSVGPEGSGKKVAGETSKVWTFLQNKLKEGHFAGEDLEMENNNGAYLWPDKNVATVELPKHSLAPRVPLIDLSNAGAKGIGNNKFSRIFKGGVLPMESFQPMKPFSRSAGFKPSNFAGVFGRRPPEDDAGLKDGLMESSDPECAGLGDVACDKVPGVGLSSDK